MSESLVLCTLRVDTPSIETLEGVEDLDPIQGATIAFPFVFTLDNVHIMDTAPNWAYGKNGLFGVKSVKPNAKI